MDGGFPDLNPLAEEAGKPSGGAVYRLHAEEPQQVSRSLRDYEHLLMYATFLNLLAEDGVQVT